MPSTRDENAAFWQRRWEEEDAPWDHGAPAPPLREFVESSGPLRGNVMVPGCGSGHDVRFIARHCPETQCLGVDVSPAALALARQTNAHPRVEFSQADFLSLPGSFQSSFDWIVEHTLFCALNPRLRQDYIAAVAHALKPGGHYLAIFYVNPSSEQGPPFRIEPAAIDELFPASFQCRQCYTPRLAYESRQGREQVRLYQYLPEDLED